MSSIYDLDPVDSTAEIITPATNAPSEYELYGLLNQQGNQQLQEGREIAAAFMEIEAIGDFFEQEPVVLSEAETAAIHHSLESLVARSKYHQHIPVISHQAYRHRMARSQYREMVLEGLVDGVKNAVQSVVDFIKRIIESILNGMRAVYNFLTGKSKTSNSSAPTNPEKQKEEIKAQVAKENKTNDEKERDMEKKSQESKQEQPLGDSMRQTLEKSIIRTGLSKGTITYLKSYINLCKNKERYDELVSNQFVGKNNGNPYQLSNIYSSPKLFDAIDSMKSELARDITAKVNAVAQMLKSKTTDPIEVVDKIVEGFDIDKHIDRVFIDGHGQRFGSGRPSSGHLECIKNLPENVVGIVAWAGAQAVVMREITKDGDKIVHFNAMAISSDNIDKSNLSKYNTSFDAVLANAPTEQSAAYLDIPNINAAKRYSENYMADIQEVNKAIKSFKVEDDDNQTAMLKTKPMLRAMSHISNWSQSLLHVCNLARSLDLIFEKLYRDHSKIIASIASSKVILDGMVIYINNSNWKEKIKTPELKQYIQLEIDAVNHVKNDAGTYDVKKSQELLARIEAKLDEIKLEI